MCCWLTWCLRFVNSLKQWGHLSFFSSFMSFANKFKEGLDRSCEVDFLELFQCRPASRTPNVPRSFGAVLVPATFLYPVRTRLASPLISSAPPPLLDKTDLCNTKCASDKKAAR